LLKHSGTKFVAGDSLTIADLQYFFEMTNMIYYEKTFSDYQLTTSWYNRVAEVDEVKAITQEWLKLAPTVIQTLKSVPVKPKL
jgi:glutathione S-transferase